MDGGAGRQAVSQTSVSSDGATNSIPQPLQAVSGENGSAAYAGGGPVYEMLVELDVHAAAESLAKSYDPADGPPAEIYAKGAAEAFVYGRGNFSDPMQKWSNSPKKSTALTMPSKLCRTAAGKRCASYRRIYKKTAEVRPDY